MRFFLSLFILLLYKTYQNNTILSTQYNSFKGIYRIFLQPEGHNVIQNIEFNLNRNFTWFKNHFPSTPGIFDQCVRAVEIPIQDFKSITVSGVVCEKKTLIDGLNITLNQFTFYLPLNNHFEGMSCAMGFASSFIDENYSIIHTLYQQKNISSLKIGFAPNRTNTCSSGNVYFGDFPQSIKEQTYKGSCSIKEKIIQWSCEVSMISIGQFKYHITNFSFFNTNTREIFIPIKLLDEIKQTFFKKYLKANKCVQFFSSNEIIYLNCNKTIVQDIGKNEKISFQIENNLYTVPLIEFFDCNLYTCDFLIMHNNNIDNSILIGTKFIDQFDTLFDYENKTISFFSSNYKIKNIKDIDVQKSIMVFLSFILSITSISIKLSQIYLNS